MNPTCSEPCTYCYVGIDAKCSYAYLRLSRLLRASHGGDVVELAVRIRQHGDQHVELRAA